MSHDDAHHAHVEVVPNPDYDGPANHCLPPPVKNTTASAIVFTLLMVAIALGASWLGGHLLG